MDREHPEHLEVHHAESQLQAEGWNNALGQVKTIWESQDVEYQKKNFLLALLLKVDKQNEGKDR